MSDHFKVVCACGAIVNQCRCPNPNKTVIKGTCAKCVQAAEPPQGYGHGV